jgi:Domain of unknown function (DUF4412)
MKRMITMVLMLAAMSAWSQGFEGTIKWSMKMDITDPKMKADLDQKMHDPATQAKMKEFEAQMNDPKMKAAMDANPQLKAQMETRKKAMESGGMTGMMPSGFTVKMKGGNTLTIMEGGMTQEVLHQKGKEQGIRLDRKNKTYSVLPTLASESNKGNKPAAPKITKTSETIKILDYTCTKYVVETQIVNGMPAKQNIWTTTDLKDFDLKGLARQRMGQGMALFYDGIDGVPLKMEMSMKEGNTVMEVTEIKKETLDAAEFTIPTDFKEVKATGRM